MQHRHAFQKRFRIYFSFCLNIFYVYFLLFYFFIIIYYLYFLRLLISYLLLFYFLRDDDDAQNAKTILDRVYCPWSSRDDPSGRQCLISLLSINSCGLREMNTKHYNAIFAINIYYVIKGKLLTGWIMAKLYFFFGYI